VTEQEWLEADDPDVILQNLQAHETSRRKLLLYACGCCRPAWDLLTAPLCREAVEICEAYADGLVRQEEVERAAGAAHHAAERLSVDQERKASLAVAQMAGVVADTPRPLHRQLRVTLSETLAQQWQVAKHAVFYALKAWSAVIWSASADQLKAEKVAQCLLWRDVSGNPFRPITLDPAWKTPAVVQLARSLYEERRFEDLPILADALEEAGCQDAAALGHCRGPGPHVRGCWVLDLLLGKE
jgi:hypothetical protein